MLCVHLEGWDREGGRETQEERDMVILFGCSPLFLNFLFILLTFIFLFFIVFYYFVLSSFFSSFSSELCG